MAIDIIVNDRDAYVAAVGNAIQNGDVVSLCNLIRAEYENDRYVEFGVIMDEWIKCSVQRGQEWSLGDGKSVLFQAINTDIHVFKETVERLREQPGHYIEMDESDIDEEYSEMYAELMENEEFPEELLAPFIAEVRRLMTICEII